LIKVAIVDDHAMFRECLAQYIANQPDLEVAGQFASSSEAMGAMGLLESGPQVVLLDVDLGNEKALDFVHAARRRGFDGKFLIVTAGASSQQAVQLIQAGVAGILHKHHSTEALCRTIRQVASGEVFLEPAYMGPLFRTVDRSRLPSGPRLTERDRAILRFILQGLTNREIAERLEVSEGAVKASLRQVFGKLGARTRAQLVKVALEQYRDQL
jgi:two-component system nitrate/nitrite response regulator NarL